MRRAVLLLLLLLWSGVPLQGQEPIPVNVQLTPREITVGDRVSAELTLVWDGEAPTDAPRFPTWQETWGKAEILEISEVEAYDDPEGRQVYTQTLVLTAFETGEISLPPMRVAVPLAESTVEVPTRAAAFAVTSVLPPAPESEGAAPDAAGEEIAPRPPAPLRELEIIERNFLFSSIVLAALLGLAVFQLLQRLSLSPAAAGLTPPPPPPLEELRRGLAAIDPVDPEPAHTAMSLALRRYLGRRLDWNAVESTTSEIQRGLRTADVDPTLAQRVVRLLRDCDRVKFARREVSGEETLERLERVRLVAHELEDRFKAAAEAAAAENQERAAA